MSDATSPFSDHQLDHHLAVLMHRRRTLVLSGPVADDHVGRFCQALLLLAAEDVRRDVRLLIHSPGGSVPAALAVADTVRAIPNDVRTVVLGTAYGAAQLLASAGTPGKRHALPHATLRIGEAGGGQRATDVLSATGAVARGLVDTVVDTAQDADALGALVDLARPPVGLGARA